MKEFTAIYCRLANTDGSGIRCQEDTLRHYAEDNGCTNIKVYIDNGFSGLTPNRPAFEALNTDIGLGKVETVIVRDFTRIGRNIQTIYGWLSYLEQHSVSLITILNN